MALVFGFSVLLCSLHMHPSRHTTMPSSTTRTVSIVVLGTGHGFSTVYDGISSAAYVLCVDHQPVLLIGAGYGVVLQCIRFFGALPRDIFIFSNRSHFAAEVPVLAAVEAHRRSRVRILGHQAVLSRIETHRLAELRDVMRDQHATIETIVDLCAVPSMTHVRELNPEEAPHVDGVVLQSAPGLSLRCFETQTSEFSAGVMVFNSHSGGTPICAFVGDSNHRCLFTETLFRVFPVVVVGARREPSSDHASFTEISDAWERTKGHRPHVHRCVVGHYGLPEDAPTHAQRGGGEILSAVEGMVVYVQLSLSIPSIADISDAHKDSRLPYSKCTVSDVRTSVIKNIHGLQLPERSVRSLSLPPAKASSSGVEESATVKRHASTRSPAAAVRTPSTQRRSSASPHRPLQASDRNTVINSIKGAPNATTDEKAQYASSSGMPTTSTSSSVATTSMASSSSLSPPPKRVYVFTNEDKAAAGRLMMAQAFRSVHQVKLRAAEILGLRPLQDLHLVPSGMVVTSVDQLQHGSSCVATKVGGEVFSLHSLPLALRRLQQSDNNSSTAPPPAAADPRRQGGEGNRHVDAASGTTFSPPPQAQLDTLATKAMLRGDEVASQQQRPIRIVDPLEYASSSQNVSRRHEAVVVAGALPIPSQHLQRSDTLDAIEHSASIPFCVSTYYGEGEESSEQDASRQSSHHHHYSASSNTTTSAASAGIDIGAQPIPTRQRPRRIFSMLSL